MGFDAAVVLGNLEIMNRKWPGQEFGITEINVDTIRSEVRCRMNNF